MWSKKTRRSGLLRHLHRHHLARLAEYDTITTSSSTSFSSATQAVPRGRGETYFLQRWIFHMIPHRQNKNSKWNAFLARFNPKRFYIDPHPFDPRAQLGRVRGSNRQPSLLPDSLLPSDLLPEWSVLLKTIFNLIPIEIDSTAKRRHVYIIIHTESIQTVSVILNNTFWNPVKIMSSSRIH